MNARKVGGNNYEKGTGVIFLIWKQQKSRISWKIKIPNTFRKYIPLN